MTSYVSILTRKTFIFFFLSRLMKIGYIFFKQVMMLDIEERDLLY